MKKIMFMLITGCFLSVINAQDFWEGVDTSKVISEEAYLGATFGQIPSGMYSSGLIYDRTGMQTRLDSADGVTYTPEVGAVEWLGMYGITRASVVSAAQRETMPEVNTVLLNMLSEYFRYPEGGPEQWRIPIGSLFYDVNKLRNDAFEANLVQADEDGNLHATGAESPFNRFTAFTCAPLIDTVPMRTCWFVLDSDYRFTNQAVPLTMEANFGDGMGWRDMTVDAALQITYPGDGRYLVQVRITDSEHVIRLAKSYLVVQEGGETTAERSKNPASSQTLLDKMEYYDTYYDLGAQAEIQVIYGCGNNDKKVRKPLFLVTGFWPENFEDGAKFRTFPNLLKRLNKNAETAWKFHQLGYDIFLFRPDDGHGDMIKNARMLQDAITEINAKKFADGYFHENVIIGYSSGAMVARYALAAMEKNHIENGAPYHHCRLMISYDGENQGANVFQGAQLAFRFVLTDAQNNGFLNALGDQLKEFFFNAALGSMQAQQLLVYYHQQTGTAATPGQGQHALRNTFTGILDNIHHTYTYEDGYPAFTRNVAIADGSSAPTLQNGFNAGDVLLTMQKNGGIPPAIFDRRLEYRATGAGPTNVFNYLYRRRYWWQNTWTVIHAENRWCNLTDPIDNAPGSHSPAHNLGRSFIHLWALTKFPITGSTTDIGKIDECFNPTVGALDIRDPDAEDWLYDLDDNQLLNVGVYQDAFGQWKAIKNAHFGYTHLDGNLPYPFQRSNAHEKTPFHAIFSLETNELHGVKSETPEMSNFILQEAEPQVREIQGRTYGLGLTQGNFTRVQTEARTGIVAGSTHSFQSAYGPVEVAAHARVSYTAGSYVTLKPGFSAKAGSTFRAGIGPQTYPCSANRPANGPEPEQDSALAAATEPATLSVWPNPAHDLLQVSVSQGEIQALCLLTLEGREAARQSASGATASLAVAALPAGMYLLRVQTREGIPITTKVVLN